MKLPPGITQEEALVAIEKSVALLAKKFARSIPLDVEDLEQIIRLESLKLLERGKFDPSRGTLDSYVYRNARNRLVNLRRDKSTRSDPPCLKCHAGERCGGRGEAEACKKYQRWQERNRSKKSLFQLTPFPMDFDVADSEPAADPETAELLELISRELTLPLRRDWLRLYEGERLPDKRHREVVEAVFEILREAGVEFEGHQYTVYQAGYQLGRCPQTVTQWCQLGRIRAKKVRNKWLIEHEELERVRREGPDQEGAHDNRGLGDEAEVDDGVATSA